MARRLIERRALVVILSLLLIASGTPQALARDAAQHASAAQAVDARQPTDVDTSAPIVGVAPDDALSQALTAPTASGANPLYPANHTFDAAPEMVGTPSANFDFETPGFDATGTPPVNSDLQAPAQDVGPPPANYDFATGDLSGWTTSGTVTLQSDSEHGSYARLDGSGASVTTAAFTVDATTQALVFDAGLLAGSVYAEIDLYVLSGPTYATRTYVAYVNCTPCTSWLVSALDARPYRGQSIKLQFQRLGGTAAVDRVRQQVLFPSMTLGGTVGRVTESDGNVYARLAGGGTLTTSPFVVTSDTQFVTVKALGATTGSDHYYLYVLSGATYQTETRVLIKSNTPDQWKKDQFNASQWRGQSIKLRVERQGGAIGVDDLGQPEVIVPGWEGTGDARVEPGGPSGQYVSLGGTLTSAAFDLSIDVQQLTFASAGDPSYSGDSIMYVYLLRGSDFSQVVPLASHVLAPAGQWTTLAVAVAPYAGETVKLRLQTYWGRMLFDSVGLGWVAVPGWTPTTTDAVATGADAHGSYVTPVSPTGTLLLRSSAIATGILDRSTTIEQRYYAVSYDIGYSASNLLQVFWQDTATGQQWTALQDAAGSPTGFRTRYFYLTDALGTDGYFVVKLAGGGKVYSIADNIARQHLNEPFSNKVGIKVDTSTGSFGYEVQDLATEGSMPLVFTRYHAGQSDQYGSLGYRWSHTYDTRLAITEDGDVGVIFGSGRELFFDGQAGLFTAADPRVHDTLVTNADGAYTFTTTANLAYQFTASGVLSSITDLNGNATTLGYDAQQQLATVTDPDGRTLTLTYDGNGRLVSLTDPAGRAVGYAYDAAGDLTTVTDVDGKLWTYAYDKHRLVSVTDPDSQVLFTNTFDSQHRVSEQIDAVGNPITIDYDTPAAGVTSVTDREGQTARYYHDRYGRTTDRVDPLGGVISNVYDGNGNLTNVIDPANNAWAFAYDASGNLTGTTDPLGNPASIAYNATHLPTTVTDARGNTTTYTYDGNGNVLTKTDPLNHTWTYTYDTSGHQLTETDPLNHTWIYTYDASGNRQTMTDPLNRVTTYTSDALGRLTSVTNPAGETIAYGYSIVGKVNRETNPLDDSKRWTYNFWGQVTSATDETGNLSVYLYDEVGNLASIVDPANQTTTFTSDANGNRLTATDPLGRTTIYAYDEHDRVIAITDPLNQTTSYTYDDAGRLATETDPLGRVTSYSYNAAGQLTSKVLPNLGVWTSTYDANGNLLTETDPLLQTTSYTYDANNQRVSMIDARNGTTSYVYDAAGRRTSITDPLNQTTSFTYDAVGNLLTRADALNHTWTYAYDAADRLISVTNPLNETTTRVHDDAGRVISTTNPLNQMSSYAYDAAGRRTSVTTPTGGVTSYAYDPRGLLTSVTDPLNHVTTYGYDDAGQRTSVTNRRNHTTSYAYDLAGRLTTMTDALAGVVTMGYDAAGQPTSLTNPNGQTTTYAYDALGNQTSVTDSLNRTQISTYDVLGQLTTTTDARDVTIGYAYDAAGNLTTTTYPGGSITETYDAADQRTTMVDGSGTTTWTYDANGQVTAVAAPNGTTSYTYDDAGRRTEMELPGNRVYTYTYDAAGRTATVGDWLSQTISFGYDASGRRTAITRPNGITSTYAYDAAGQVTAIDHAGTGLGSTLSFIYTYDAEGNRTSMTSGAGTETYTLDALNRLTSVTYANSDVVAYTYDATGNRLTETLNGTTAHTYTYDDADQLTSDGTDSYTYDAAGNTLSAGSDSYAWDWANRLTGATVDGVSSTYSYDGDDTRTSATTGGNTSAYLWDRLGDVELLIDDGANAYLHEGGVLSEIDSGGDTTYDLADGLGSVRGLTDESGVLTGSTSYDAFGSVTSQSGATSTFGYTGEQTDPAGDLYLRARTYDTETGRFLSEDTVQPNAPGTQGYNRYAYVANNPATWNDPTGHVAAAAVAWGPELSPLWLIIGEALGIRFAIAACAAAPLGCAAVAVFAIVVFIIVACVLEIGSPCWDWVPYAQPKPDQAGPKPSTPPGGNVTPINRHPPSENVDPVPPDDPWEDDDDDPCTAARLNYDPDKVNWNHIADGHAPGTGSGQQFDGNVWYELQLDLLDEAVMHGSGIAMPGQNVCRIEYEHPGGDFVDVDDTTTRIGLYITSSGVVRTAFPVTPYGP